jgi:DNA adenine methylase
MDYKVQSVLFLKSKWTETTASDWLLENSYKIKKVDITEKYLRFRQINPEYLQRTGYTHFVNKKIGKGISLIIAYKEQQGGAVSASNVKRFVEASYKKKADENINDYILDKSLSNDYAKTYFNPKTHQAVVVHRGTSGASDWLNNVAYASGLYNFTNRYKTGKKIQDKASKKYGKENISTLGHSQGAVLSRKLGQDTKEIINLNPAYMGEAPTKKEYNIRSSTDLVSGLLAPVNILKGTLYPSYTKNHEITIQSDNPVDVLTEHSPEILNRLDPEMMIGKGMGGGVESNDYLFRILANAFKKLTEIKQEAQQAGNTELMGDMRTPFAQLFSQLYHELMVQHLDTTLEGDELNSYLSTRIRNIEDLMGRQFLEYDDKKLGGKMTMKGGIKSPFCRTGSKYYMRDMIVPLIPSHKIYVELFAGTSAIFFSKEKAEMNVLNDLDKSVINKYKVLLKSPDNLESYNKDLNTKDKIRHFYDHHSNNPQNELLLEKITSCNGFGSKPVTYANMIYKSSNPYNSLVKHLPEYKELLKGVKLETKDYEKIVDKYDSPDTFFFIDPPYENTNTTFGYAEDKNFDFIRLRKVLDKIKGSFLLTINDSPQVRSLFKGFKLTPVKIQSGFRNAGLGKNSGEFDKVRGELMITNYSPEKAEGGTRTPEMSESEYQGGVIDIDDSDDEWFGAGTGASVSNIQTIQQRGQEIETLLVDLREDVVLINQFLDNPEMVNEDANPDFIEYFETLLEEKEIEIEDLERELNDIYSYMGYELGAEVKEGGVMSYA